jgi:hypothetical protein
VSVDYQWVPDIPPDELLGELGPIATGLMIAYFAYSFWSSSQGSQ